MMKSFFCLLACIALFSFVPVQGNDWQDFMLHGAATDFPVEVKNEGQKRIPVGFLLSAVVPGAGQAYNGSWLKAAGFLAAEVAAWTLYAHYHDKGMEQEKEFHAYADRYWIEEDYWEWISIGAGIPYNQENLEQLRAWEGETFSHGLHRQKDQQYYEMIGKYHQFNAGWEDATRGIIIDGDYDIKGDISSRRLIYEGMRDDSNRSLKHATSAASVALVNHLVSGLEAAWSISRDNKRRAHFGLRMEAVPSFDSEPTPVLSLRVIW
ncbi:hypothetical protein JW992_10305 [candidate division KSB1 bacterium]|nr:hypothetical protein [candidate division KSB1 bacterium]